jgi:hypothetical protein
MYPNNKLLAFNGFPRVHAYIGQHFALCEAVFSAFVRKGTIISGIKD